MDSGKAKQGVGREERSARRNERRRRPSKTQHNQPEGGDQTCWAERLRQRSPEPSCGRRHPGPRPGRGLRPPTHDAAGNGTGCGNEGWRVMRLGERNGDVTSAWDTGSRNTPALAPEACLPPPPKKHLHSVAVTGASQPCWRRHGPNGHASCSSAGRQREVARSGPRAGHPGGIQLSTVRLERSEAVVQLKPTLCSFNGVGPQWLFWVLQTPKCFAKPS